MHCLRHLKQIKRLVRHYSVVVNSCHQNSEPTKHKFLLSKPILDEKFLLDEKNIEKISENVKLREGVGDIHHVYDIKNKLKSENLNQDEKISLNEQLQEALRKIPNDTHPEVRDYGNEPKVLSFFNKKPEFKHKPLEFSEISKKLNLLRTDHLGNYAGHKSFFLMSDLAELVSSTDL